jgi:cytochrome c oxidase subunit IV
VHRILTGVGIFLGFLANLLIVVFVSDKLKVWRILTNTVLIPTIPLLVMIYLMPESPRYLMKVRTSRAIAGTKLISVSTESTGRP